MRTFRRIRPGKQLRDLGTDGFANGPINSRSSKTPSYEFANCSFMNCMYKVCILFETYIERAVFDISPESTSHCQEHILGGPNLLLVSALALGDSADMILGNRGKPLTGYH